MKFLGEMLKFFRETPKKGRSKISAKICPRFWSSGSASVPRRPLDRPLSVKNWAVGLYLKSSILEDLHVLWILYCAKGLHLGFRPTAIDLRIIKMLSTGPRLTRWYAARNWGAVHDPFIRPQGNQGFWPSVYMRLSLLLMWTSTYPRYDMHRPTKTPISLLEKETEWRQRALIFWLPTWSWRSSPTNIRPPELEPLCVHVINGRPLTVYRSI